MKHYDLIAQNFEENWFFDKNYIPTFIKEICEALEFQKLNYECNILDLGCGTGHYLQEVIKSQNNIKFKIPITGVDLSQKMIDIFNSKKEFQGHCKSADIFISSKRETYDRIISKEVIHHIKDISNFAKNINNALTKDGKALIITRPKKTTIPFSKSCHELFSKSQPDFSHIKKELQKSMVSFVTKEISIPVKIKKEHFYQMIRNRFMSCFNELTDKKIDESINELNHFFSNDDVIEFNDCFHFILISK